MSEKIKGRKHPMWGKKHTEEAKKKISNFFKGRKRPENEVLKIRERSILRGKKIICKENNKIYPSISEASRDLKIQRNKIRLVLQEKRKHAKRFTFSYVTDNI